MSMFRIVFVAAAVTVFLLGPGDRPAALASEGEDTVMGEYAGIYTLVSGRAVHAEAKVVAEGDGNYRAVLFAEMDPPMILELNRAPEAGGLVLAGKGGSMEWGGRIDKGMLFAGAKSGEGGAFQLLRVTRRSPTEGLEPPPGAVLLLPFEEGKPTSLDEWTNKNWKLLPDGSVQVFKGPNRTVRDHGSGLFHVEFRLPYEPKGRGQGRGNSGVYFGSRYEIQILDSFGLDPGMGDCGSLYGVAITRENACLPPLAWQTYDVLYRAPRKKADGTFEPAMMTVFHNGVKIHENQTVPAPTTASPEKANAMRGPLYLQDHGHPVCYRNIWYLELKD